MTIDFFIKMLVEHFKPEVFDPSYETQILITQRCLIYEMFKNILFDPERSEELLGSYETLEKKALGKRSFYHLAKKIEPRIHSANFAEWLDDKIKKNTLMHVVNEHLIPTGMIDKDAEDEFSDKIANFFAKIIY